MDFLRFSEKPTSVNTAASVTVLQFSPDPAHLLDLDTASPCGIQHPRLGSKALGFQLPSTAAKEARHAAKKAEQQTDPEQYADFAVRLIDERTGEILGKMNQTSRDLSSVANHAQGVLRKIEDDGSASYRAIWEREQKVDRFKARLPWLAGGLAVLFVVGSRRLLHPTVLGGSFTKPAIRAPYSIMPFGMASVRTKLPFVCNHYFLVQD